MPVEATMDKREAVCPKICFVGHGFHQRTKSSKFFISILREIGDVDEYYSAPDDHDLDDDDIIFRLSKGGYDLYVFWQCDFLAERLHGLNLGRFVIVPMYDGARGRPDIFWRQFIDCQFISFSRAHHELLRRLGCRSHYFQYWSEPKPTFPERDVERLAGFFWERRPDSALDLARVIRLCRMLGISVLHLHAVSDLETLQRRLQDAPPWRQGVPDVQVTVSQWFDNFEDFDATATTPLFFFAPRQTEGIGMAVVEAMGRGQIVVSPDAVTMNEYIGRNVTGVLYDIDGPDRDFGFNAGDLARMSRAAYDKARLGHRRWLKDIERLKSILQDDGQRWSSSDFSSHFLNDVRRAASQRLFRDGAASEMRTERDVLADAEPRDARGAE